MKSKKIVVCLICLFALLLVTGCANNKEPTCDHDWIWEDCEGQGVCAICGEINTKSITHDFVGSCGEKGVCSRCGKVSSYTFTHSWKGNIKTGYLYCKNCDDSISYSDIKGKNFDSLTNPEKAYLYWQLDYYLTATDKKGKYKYTEAQAFYFVESNSGVSEYDLRNHIWTYSTFLIYTDYYD